MYAVIETGGKQYRVELGSELVVERLDAAPGETVNFERVLLVADGDAAQIGMPLVADALVTGEVVRQDRGAKVIVFKYRPKARHRAKKGHRQEQTVVRVADIRFNGRSAADEAGVQEKRLTKARKAAAAEAEQKAAADQELAAKLAEAAERRSAAEPSAGPGEASPKEPASRTRQKATATKATAKPTAAKAPDTKQTTKKATATKAATTQGAASKAAKSESAEAKPRKADTGDLKPTRAPRTTKKDE